MHYFFFCSEQGKSVGCHNQVKEICFHTGRKLDEEYRYSQLNLWVANVHFHCDSPFGSVTGLNLNCSSVCVLTWIRFVSSFERTSVVVLRQGKRGKTPPRNPIPSLAQNYNVLTVHHGQRLRIREVLSSYLVPWTVCSNWSSSLFIIVFISGIEVMCSYFNFKFILLSFTIFAWAPPPQK
jgi:hypothetical protein